jgi:hypothetical protein
MKNYLNGFLEDIYINKMKEEDIIEIPLPSPYL